MTPERLAEIQARVEAATEGPWGVGDDDQMPNRLTHRMGYAHSLAPEPNDPIDPTEGSPRVFTCDIDHGQITVHEAEANAEFVSHARTDVPNLLAHIAALTEENGKLRASMARAVEIEQELRHGLGDVRDRADRAIEADTIASLYPAPPYCEGCTHFHEGDRCPVPEGEDQTLEHVGADSSGWCKTPLGKRGFICALPMGHSGWCGVPPDQGVAYKPPEEPC